MVVVVVLVDVVVVVVVVEATVVGAAAVESVDVPVASVCASICGVVTAAVAVVSGEVVGGVEEIACVWGGSVVGSIVAGSLPEQPATSEDTPRTIRSRDRTTEIEAMVPTLEPLVSSLTSRFPERRLHRASRIMLLRWDQVVLTQDATWRVDFRR